MSQSTELTMIPFEQMLPGSQGWATLKQQAGELIRSGFLPSGIKTPEQAVVIILKGRELGIPPMQALSHIHVISGKPTMSSELMLSQILRLHPKTKISYPKRSGEVCELKVQREGSDPSVFSFSMADAQAAGLLNNPTWKKYPRAMLHARCVSEMARSLFPDAISGVSYTPEELGANVNESGEVIDIESSSTTSELGSENDKGTVAKTTVPTTKNPPSAPAFDPTNATHVRSVGTFLQSKNQMSLFDALANRLVGKPFTKDTVEAFWAEIDPEAPDKEPEVME
jgi:hypothetical protein